MDFEKKRSTDTQLLAFTQDILANLSGGRQTDALRVTSVVGRVSRVAASEGWFVLDNANAMKIWPRNPGGRRRGGPYKRGAL